MRCMAVVFRFFTIRFQHSTINSAPNIADKSDQADFTAFLTKHLQICGFVFEVKGTAYSTIIMKR
jgi:hypothetical protein